MTLGIGFDPTSAPAHTSCRIGL